MSKGMTNGYLQSISKKILGKQFYGVFPCDLPPKPVKSKFFVIFNLSKHNEKGTHFVAIFYNSKKLYYFDPLGDKLTNGDILNFIKTLKRKLIEENVKIQSDLSDFCGFFCLGYLLSKKLKMSSKIFFKQFNQINLLLNDEKIMKFICSKI